MFCFGHPQFLSMRLKHNSMSAFAKQSGWSVGTGLAVLDPFVHAPEMACFSVESERVDDAGDQRQLLGRADRAADAGGVVGRRLLPGVDVFERLGEVKIFERVVEVDGEARARKLQQRSFSVSPRGVVEKSASSVV